MKSNFSKALEFHQVFGLNIGKEPSLLKKEELKLRISLMEEEWRELYAELVRYDPNINSIAKELSDLLYVVYGTAVSMGIDIDKIYNKVHISNMSKLDINGNVIRRSDGKILKSDQYKPVEMEGLLKDASISEFKR